LSTRKILVSTAAITCVLSAALLHGSAFAAGFGKATGDIGWTTAFLGSDANAQFVAQGTDPARGNVTVSNHDNVSFTGTVTCYQDLGGGLADFGGTISSYSFVDPSLGNADQQGLQYFLFVVSDIGSPGNLNATADPDRITLFRPASAPDCASPGLGANRQLTYGNLVIHQP
jgi:hypothetical protein